MISRLGSIIAGVFRRTCPDPFVIAILLTLLTAGLCWGLTDAGPTEVIDAFIGGKGMWNLLLFSMQMCLVLVTGHALASSPPVAWMVQALARQPGSAAQATALVALIAGACAVVNWGLGLIVGALMAREVGRAMAGKGIRVHYPLLAAAGYVGLMVWHGGLSGSAPLKVTAMSDLLNILGPELAAQIQPMPLQQTIGSTMNIVITGGLVLGAPALFMLLHPRNEAEIETFTDFRVPTYIGEPALGSDDKDAQLHMDEPPASVPEWLERKPWLAGLFALFLVAALVQAVRMLPGIGSVDLNHINLIMLILGLAMHGSPARYVRAVDEAARGCGGIILQFPLYAGIMGMMSDTGLSALIATKMASFADAQSLPLVTFFSASVVNLFVPSGGGQWAVQGPIVVKTALDAGVDPGKMVMALAYGDQLTNMLQPFWALPLLAITGVRARDIVGYTAIVMTAAAVWIGVWLLVL
ncbi:MAG: short-chain fatty acid transporter [Phycisphaerales bacterium]|nr:short-chain fatty acid transporter [Phycisphaerales bacterium]